MINEPIYVGFSILDLNKLLLYEPVYNYIKRELIDNLLFIDTESLIYEISVNYVDEDFIQRCVCLILVIIHKIQSFFIMSIKK